MEINHRNGVGGPMINKSFLIEIDLENRNTIPLRTGLFFVS